MFMQLAGGLVLKEATTEWNKGELVSAIALFALYCWLSKQ
jgi:hypothetical protein